MRSFNDWDTRASLPFTDGMNVETPDSRIIMAVQQRALKKLTINVMRPVIQDIHQPNSNMWYYAVALNSVRM